MKLIVSVFLLGILLIPTVASACPDGYFNCGGDLCCPNPQN
ncbi:MULTISPECIES: hypothetical protein [unclassified Ruegeria]|nr:MULTISPECIES: hypothetical protein [unclassified Ruegeria]